MCNDVDLHVDLIGNHNFIIPKKYNGVVNLFVTESVTAEINFFCADAIDLTIRLIVLFPETADITLSVMVCGDHSKIAILGICALSQQQAVIIKTTQIHCGKQSQSTLVLQGLITDHARLTYDGTIRIEKDACGTYALQNNKNILLSSTAAAISIPNIEVLNHDVQCYHGAAVGKFNMQQMQYMQSRGLGKLMIQQLLVQELFAQVLQGYEKREFILQTVYKKI
jgi:Fe-S cluster assembly protein SufD